MGVASGVVGMPVGSRVVGTADGSLEGAVDGALPRDWLEPLKAIPRVILKGLRSVRSRGWERGQARVQGWVWRWAGSLAAARA